MIDDFIEETMHRTPEKGDETRPYSFSNGMAFSPLFSYSPDESAVPRQIMSQTFHEQDNRRDELMDENIGNVMMRESFEEVIVLRARCAALELELSEKTTALENANQQIAALHASCHHLLGIHDETVDTLSHISSKFEAAKHSRISEITNALMQTPSGSTSAAPKPHTTGVEEGEIIENREDRNDEEHTIKQTIDIENTETIPIDQSDLLIPLPQNPDSSDAEAQSKASKKPPRVPLKPISYHYKTLIPPVTSMNDTNTSTNTATSDPPTETKGKRKRKPLQIMNISYPHNQQQIQQEENTMDILPKSKKLRPLRRDHSAAIATGTDDGVDKENIEHGSTDIRGIALPSRLQPPPPPPSCPYPYAPYPTATTTSNYNTSYYPTAEEIITGNTKEKILAHANSLAYAFATAQQRQEHLSSSSSSSSGTRHMLSPHHQYTYQPPPFLHPLANTLLHPLSPPLPSSPPPSSSTPSTHTHSTSNT